MTELKPCPFCDGEAEYRAAKYVRTVFKHSVVCLECFASIPPKASEQEAIEAWNTRAEREVGISKFQKITGTSYIEAKSILTSLEQAGAKVVE
jgi:Lar family restriction alleviation protein